MSDRIREILFWLGIISCLMVVAYCILGSVLAAYFDVSEIGFLIFSLPFIVEAVLLFVKKRNDNPAKLSSSIIHLVGFSTIVVALGVGVNLIHDPLADLRAQPILAAIDAYKVEHGRYPSSIHELDIELDHGSVHYETKGVSGYYNLTLKSGLLFDKRCHYWVSSVGSNRGQRDQRCTNKNF